MQRDQIKLTRNSWDDLRCFLGSGAGRMLLASSILATAAGVTTLYWGPISGFVSHTASLVHIGASPAPTADQRQIAAQVAVKLSVQDARDAVTAAEPYSGLSAQAHTLAAEADAAAKALRTVTDPTKLQAVASKLAASTSSLIAATSSAKAAADAAAQSAQHSAAQQAAADAAAKQAAADAAKAAAAKAAQGSGSSSSSGTSKSTSGASSSGAGGSGARSSISVTCAAADTLTVTASGSGTVTVSGGGRSSSGSGGASVSAPVGAGSFAFTATASGASVHISWADDGSGNCT